MSFQKTTTKPDRVRETFIVTAIAVFFISAGIFFFYPGKDDVIKTIPAKPAPAEASSRKLSPDTRTGASVSSASGELRPQKNILLKTPDFIKSAAENKYVVSPPIPSLNSVQQSVLVDAGAGQIITSEHHSRIIIPPGAFLDKKGNVVNGNVEVKYREFYNYLDIFLSGIPMNYGTGDAEQLESAGMLEITASQGDEPVYVNNDRKINVMLASMQKSTDYNLYYFDEQKNKWIEKGKDNVITSPDGAAGWNFVTGKRDSIEKIFSYSKPAYHVKAFSSSDMTPKKDFFLGRKKDPYTFTFHFVNSNKSIPELKALGNITWRYSGKDAMRIYNRMFRTGSGASVELIPKTWNDLSILPEEEDQTYSLFLCNEKDTLEVKILPQFTGENSRKRFNMKFNSFLLAQNNRQRASFAALQKFKSDTSDYYSTNGRYERTTVAAEYYVMRQFQIDGFGIWNCDQPRGLPKGAAVTANFVDQDNNPLHPERVFLADKSKNTVYTYYRNNLNNFRFNPDAENMVWVVFPGDKVAVISASEFREKYSMQRKSCTFKFDMSEKAVATMAELRSKLKFNL